MRNLLVAGALTLALSACSTPPQFTPKPQPSAVVKVLAGSGHGSGFHYGDRFIVTAAHVVEGVETATIKTDDGAIRTATLLWVNKAHDVALLRLDGDAPPAMKASKLTCREPAAGQGLRAAGNPGSLEFVSTYGRVSGKARKFGPWSSVVVYDGTVAPGMSGGPVYDTDENVTGITVGLMVVPSGFSASLVPVSYVVPASAICMLMGR